MQITRTLRLMVCCCVAVTVLAACANGGPRNRAVYMLMDTSGTYKEELNKAKSIVNYLLGTLHTGDALALARVDSGSFSEKDIIAHVTFSDKPSVANGQKRAMKEQVDTFMANIGRSKHTDITGGILQAVEFINETGAGEKYILIFSDLEEDLIKGYVRDIPLPLNGFTVIAVNVTKLRSDNVDPRGYMQRVDQWQARVTSGGGQWRVINDLENLDKMLSS